MANAVLPDDVLLQILVRLPLKSLQRFRCVSKPWNVLISSQYFVRMHLNRSLIHPKPLRFIWRDEVISKDSQKFVRLHLFTADCYNLENSTAHAIQPLHHPLEVPCLSDPVLIGSCNGLLCLLSPRLKDSSSGERYDDCFFMVNPLTRRCSVSYGAPFSPRLGLRSISRSSFCGFGYDDAHDDYKVVTWGVCPKYFGGKSGCSKIEVYSVSNASWSTIISGLSDCYVNGISCGVLVNCTLHWISTNNEGRFCIVAFDLRTDQHRLLETPESDLAIPKHDDSTGLYLGRMELGVLNGSLCGIVLDGDVPVELDLWVMKEYGIHESWTKMTIDMSYNKFRWRDEVRFQDRKARIVPIVYMENKKQLILYSYTNGFLLCDMVSNKLSKIIKIPGLNHEEVMRFSYVQKEFCFQGSLVELPGFDSFDAVSDECMVAEPKNKRRRMQDNTA